MKKGLSVRIFPEKSKKQSSIANEKKQTKKKHKINIDKDMKCNIITWMKQSMCKRFRLLIVCKKGMDLIFIVIKKNQKLPLFWIIWVWGTIALCWEWYTVDLIHWKFKCKRCYHRHMMADTGNFVYRSIYASCPMMDNALFEHWLNSVNC